MCRYENGKLLKTYSGDRSYDHLSSFIDEHAQEYAAKQLEPRNPEDGAEAIFKASRPNPDGKVANVDEAGLKALRDQGGVLVEYFAPWCGQ
jgi:hypothetical protein